MRAIIFGGDCVLDLATVPDPTPGPGEVVLEIKASGMCGSDLHRYRSSHEALGSPVVAGHEPCGVVVAIGPGVSSPLAYIGSRVMVHHYKGCSCCADCRSGWPQMCSTAPILVYGTDADGSHAPYMKVFASTLVKLDERLSFAAGAAISCGTGTAWGAFERMGLTGRDTLAVFGQGPVGLSATLLAKAMGARVIAIDIDQTRLNMASACGADHVLNPVAGDVTEAIRAITNGMGATMALETSGTAPANRDALTSVRPWGTVGLVGIGAELSFSLGKMLRRQLRIVTSWTMSLPAQQTCAEFVVDRGIDLDVLFTDHWRLDQAEEAYKKFNQQSSGKGVFVM